MIAAIKQCAKELGRAPNFTELQKKFPKLSRKTLRRRFGSYGYALQECKLEPSAGFGYSMDQLLVDWAAVVRKIKRLPSVQDFGKHSRYTISPFVRRFKSWFNVPLGMEQYIANKGLLQQYGDILEMIKARQAEKAKWAKQSVWGGPAAIRPLSNTGPVFGLPLTNMALVFAPTNEAGVLLLFGMLAERLGFIVTQVQSAFPDCHALLKLDEDTCQLMRIEFEFESRNFLEHGHPVKGCDMIVCWIHNWKECPLQVVELRPIVMELLNGGGEK